MGPSLRFGSPRHAVFGPLADHCVKPAGFLDTRVRVFGWWYKAYVIVYQNGPGAIPIPIRRSHWALILSVAEEVGWKVLSTYKVESRVSGLGSPHRGPISTSDSLGKSSRLHGCSRVVDTWSGGVTFRGFGFIGQGFSLGVQMMV